MADALSSLVPAPAAAEPAEGLAVRRLRRGDGRAFEELVVAHQDRVFRLVLRMLGDAAEAEDVSQEVFVAVHQALPRFRGDSRLSTWIWRIAKNQAINRLKSRERHETEDLATTPEDQLGEHKPLPDAIVDEHERRIAVQRAVARLEPHARLVVALRDLEGLSYEEIAEILEEPLGTVKSRLHRARLRLAELLAGEGLVR